MKKYAIRLLLSILVGVASVGSAEAQHQQCAGNLVNTGPIRGIQHLNANQTRTAQNSIARLTFAELFRNPPFRITEENLRLDAQGNTGTHHNWQVQVGNGTSAAALIDNRFQAANTSDLQRFVEGQSRNALI